MEKVLVEKLLYGNEPLSTAEWYELTETIHKMVNKNSVYQDNASLFTTLDLEDHSNEIYVRLLNRLKNKNLPPLEVKGFFSYLKSIVNNYFLDLARYHKDEAILKGDPKSQLSHHENNKAFSKKVILDHHPQPFLNRMYRWQLWRSRPGQIPLLQREFKTRSVNLHVSGKGFLISIRDRANRYKKWRTTEMLEYKKS